MAAIGAGYDAACLSGGVIDEACAAQSARKRPRPPQASQAPGCHLPPRCPAPPRAHPPTPRSQKARAEARR
eukprot:CAMPEP_0184389602 /NCGR_PEP_ID=MMETSP0007-20130409/12627_1 /TAXON_ID=97485 /ORGANISM="Prymnesium parvum, Strain Texoma1" /LENGTH=70 /DNA_ID=CAMNT_0026739005 /DNA_START=188 /DNA_END=398 /DNA_ORIENTATION=-